MIFCSSWRDFRSIVSYSVSFAGIRGFFGSAHDGTMEEGAGLMTGCFLCLRRSRRGGAIDVRLRGGLGLSGIESWMAVIEVSDWYIVVRLYGVQGLRLDVLGFGMRCSAIFVDVRNIKIVGLI